MVLQATQQPNVLDMLAQALAPALAKQLGVKSATGTPTSYLAFGPGGLFSTAGVEQDVIATVVQPTGLLSVLPAYPTVYTSPLFEFISGFLADTGSEAATTCADCATAGIKKGCIQTAQFGRYCRETKELSLERLVQRVNRAEPTDLRLLNPVFSAQGLGTLTPGFTRQNPFAGEVQQALLEVGVSLERLLAPQVWTGNPANNNVGGGYQEFPGLQILVSTGKVDAISNVSCPSLNSDIKNLNYQDVCAVTNPAGGIVEVVSNLVRYVRKNASTMGMDPVVWRFVMREELFYELTSCWPCSYMTYRCTPQGPDKMAMVDSADMIQMRDSMRTGRYLIVDGVRFEVILDDGIPEATNTNNANLAAGQFSSDIYFLPFSVRGNFATLYMEYQDFSQAQGQVDLARMGFRYWVTDGGKFIWETDNVGGCFLMKAIVKPRIILRTPHLAGRIQNVMYQPLQHTRQPFPTDGYFADGGATTRTAPTYYSEWSG